MADLNALIAQGVQFKAPQDPFAQYAQMQQLQQGQQANQLNQMKMQEYQRGVAETNALRQLDPSSPAYLKDVMRISPEKGYAYGKLQQESETAKLTQSKTKADLAKSKKEFVQQAQRDTSRNPSDANVTAFKEDLMASDLFTDAEKAQMAAGADRILAMPLGERQSFMASQGATAGELKPTLTPQTLGATTQVLSTPAFGGTASVVPGSVGKVTNTPYQTGQLGISQGNLAVNQQRLGLEGQRLGLEGQRVQIAQAESARKTAGLAELPPKEVQKREAAFPQATSAIKGFEIKSDSFVRDLIALRDHPGLSQITGIAAGRLPAVTGAGRAAQAMYEKVIAKGGFQALQDLRDASKTGGALGNVSNQEGKQLAASFSAIDRKQDAGDVRAALDQAIADVQGSRTRMREAYDATYQYKSGNAPGATNLDALLDKYK